MRLLVAAVALAGCAGAATPSSPTTPMLATAIATADQARQPLVVEFGAPWCKPCRAFAATVLTDPRVRAELATITFVQYDVETPAGADAAKRCNVAGVPAIVSLDRAGGIVRTLSAVPDADGFIAFLRATRP
jgi:thiol:disulfide interchange protein